MPRQKGPAKVKFSVSVRLSTHERLQRKARGKAVGTYVAEKLEREDDVATKNDLTRQSGSDSMAQGVPPDVGTVARTVASGESVDGLTDFVHGAPGPVTLTAGAAIPAGIPAMIDPATGLLVPCAGAAVEDAALVMEVPSDALPSLDDSTSVMPGERRQMRVRQKNAAASVCKHPINRRIGSGCGACGKDPVK